VQLYQQARSHEEMGAAEMGPWEKTPEYSTLMQACREGNQLRIQEILGERLSRTVGEERTFWLRMRTNFLWEACLNSNEFAPAWTHLETVSIAAGNDPVIRRDTLILALGMLAASEDATRYRSLRLVLSRKGLPKGWQEDSCWGRLCLQRGQWRRAVRLLSQAVEGFKAQPDELFNRNWGYLVYYLSQGAVAHLACGQTGIAEAWVREAEELVTRPRSDYLYPVHLAVAQAELHLHCGEYQQARTDIQSARARADARKVTIYAVDQVAILMLVARIARCEGNPDGFRHFCEQALDICTTYKLRMSEKRVRALLAGADR
jgi:tetratricopeptide (TPR) repeat protein